MQPASYYKLTHLADAQRDAIEWLAAQLRWERTLEALRTHDGDLGERKAA